MRKFDFILVPILLAIALYLTFDHSIYEPVIISILGLSYTAFYLFVKSKQPLKDSIKIFLGLFLGFFFDTLFMNLNFYFYSLIDYPFLTYPPMYMALFWLIVPIHIIGIKQNPPVYHFYFGAIHLLLLISLQNFDLVFIEEPKRLNTIALFFLWSLAYKIILKVDLVNFSFRK